MTMSDVPCLRHILFRCFQDCLRLEHVGQHGTHSAAVRAREPPAAAPAPLKAPVFRDLRRAELHAASLKLSGPRPGPAHRWNVHGRRTQLR